MTETAPDLDAIVATVKVKVKVNIEAGNAAIQELESKSLSRSRSAARISINDPRLQFIVRVDEQITNCKTKVGTS
ncbi:MAG: hypothetical protein ABJ327_05175 [Litoreibacter sp.]